MQAKQLADIRPFEICSIRPPTENYSLTFRLLRNCYWKKCGFCPLYKTGAKFRKRPVQEVKEDISNARLLDDIVREEVFAGAPDNRKMQERAEALAGRIKQAWKESGVLEKERSTPLGDSPDPRVRWFSSWFIDYPDISDCIEHLVVWRLTGVKTCFLGDADALILKPEYIQEVMSHIRENFPGFVKSRLMP